MGIFGLGYVGLTTAAALLREGITVAGYEISTAKRAFLAAGICPIRERGVKAAIEKGLKAGSFRVADFIDPGALPEIVLICVGTPQGRGGAADLDGVDQVFSQLDKFVRTHRGFQAEVILRSTVPPGTLAGLRTRHPRLFAAVPVAYFPEFLREGSALRDFDRAPRSIVGLLPSSRKPGRLLRLLAGLRSPGPVTQVHAVTAESVKYASNAYHALKVCFANEVARLVTACGGDAVEVMRLFCQDTRLNLSRQYLRPGNPYGGSCLPKDTRAMVRLGRQRGIKLDLIGRCAGSNDRHLAFIVEAVRRHRPRVVALLGLSFKPDTADLRHSPSVALLPRLTRAGVRRIQGHDFLLRTGEAVDLNRRLQDRLAANAAFVLHRDLPAALASADLVLVMHADRRYARAVSRLAVPVLDVAAWAGFGRTAPASP